MIDWKEVVREYRYIHKKFKDPYKICVAAHKAVEELEKKILELERELKEERTCKPDWKGTLKKMQELEVENKELRGRVDECFSFHKDDAS